MVSKYNLTTPYERDFRLFEHAKSLYHNASKKASIRLAINNLTEVINAQNELLPMVLYYRGRCWNILGKFDKSIADIKQALSINPDDKEARDALNWAVFNKKKQEEVVKAC